MKNLATILPLKSKLSGKFQRFNATDRTGLILDIGVMGAFFVGTFSEKREFCLLAPHKQMSFLVISYENILIFFTKLSTLDCWR